MSLERNLLPAPGPRFALGEDGDVLFSFVIDATNMIGPRPATKRDQFEHAAAWRAFCATQMDEALEAADTPPAEAELVIPDAPDLNGADPAEEAPKGGNRRKARAS